MLVAMPPLELLSALGSSAAVVVTVWLFLKASNTRDKDFMAASKARDDRMAAVLDRNSDALNEHTQISGQMVEALRRINGRS